MTRAARKPARPPLPERTWAAVAAEGVAAVAARNADLTGDELARVMAAANPYTRGNDPAGSKAWEREARRVCGERRGASVYIPRAGARAGKQGKQAVSASMEA